MEGKQNTVYARACCGVWHIDLGASSVHVRQLGAFARAIVARKLGVSRHEVEIRVL